MFDYDVALSFAGEDREYVKRVADILHAIDVKVFYDEFYEIRTWGKNLYEEFDDIYQKKSKYCIMFISKHYKQKAWTNHERQSAQARDLIESREYILPVRFDDTQIQGLRPTIATIDARKNTPEELAYKIAKKVNPNIDVVQMLKFLQEYLIDYKINVEETKIIFESNVEDFNAEFPLRLLLEMYRIGQIENMFLLPAIVPH